MAAKTFELASTAITRRLDALEQLRVKPRFYHGRSEIAQAASRCTIMFSLRGTSLRPFLFLLAVSHSALALPHSLDGFSFRFEQNRGQASSEIRYIARANGYTLLLGDQGVAFRAPGRSKATVINFASVSPRSSIEVSDPLRTLVNDYTGPHDTWVTGAPCWARLTYRNLSPGIDLTFYSNGNQLEYDLRVQAGADPSRLAFVFDPTARPTLEASGNLVFSLPSGVLAWHKPVAYQLVAGQHRPVEASFTLQANHVSFRVAAWDRRYPLVIDPTLSLATYFGGAGTNAARGIAVDSSGNILIAGGTTSGNLPGLSANSFQVDYKGLADDTPYPGDAFIAKMNASASALLWVTYLGGTGNDSATSLAVDSSGNAYVTGSTDSGDFPIGPSKSSVVQGTFGGGGGGIKFHEVGDAFVAKFDSNGKLLWSTYLGGSQDDIGTAIAVDSAGNAYIAGATVSANFPGVAGGYQSTFGGKGGQPTLDQGGGYVSFDSGDAFVAKIDPTGAHLSATYFGGSLDDFALALSIDSSGNIWIGGGTISKNLPLTGAFQSNYAGGTGAAAQPIFSTGDGFIAKFSSDLKTSKYSTYFGGSKDDVILGIAVDSSGAIYVAGATQSPNLPGASNAYHGPSPLSSQASPFIIGDAFVAKLQPGGSQLAFSFYLGGGGEDAATGLVVDAQGNITIAGSTNSPDFCAPTPDAVSATLNGGASSVPPVGFGLKLGDGFIARFSNSGTMTYCSFIGGSSYDFLGGLTLDSSGNIYAAGLSSSTNFPTTAGVVQKNKAGLPDAMVIKLAVAPNAPVVNAVVNGASFAGGGVVPGEIATLFGVNLTASSGINLTSTLPLPNSFLNDSVLVNTQPAPLFAVDNVNGQQQINFQVPWEVADGPAANIAVNNNGTTSSSISVPVLAAQPGIFNYSVGGNTFGAILHANFQLADTTHPAIAAETVLIYCTGLGTVHNPPNSGAAGNGQTTTASPTVKIGGKNSTVTFSGLAPGFVGLYQINAVIPAGLASGNQAVVVTLSGASSNSVLLPVK